MAVDPAMIDRVFSNSPNLSTDAVKHFVTQLCAVSSQEVNHSAATFRCDDWRPGCCLLFLVVTWRTSSAALEARGAKQGP